MLSILPNIGRPASAQDDQTFGLTSNEARRRTTGSAGAQAQSYRENCPLPASTNSHIACLNFLERRPSYLRHIGVDCTIKLAERGSVDTALFQ